MPEAAMPNATRQFRVEFFVRGKFRGAVLVFAADRLAAFARAADTPLYRELNGSGRRLTMVRWSARPVSGTIS